MKHDSFFGKVQVSEPTKTTKSLSCFDIESQINPSTYLATVAFIFKQNRQGHFGPGE